MHAKSEVVANTREENSLRSQLALRTRYGASADELDRLRKEYHRAVARRKAAEYAAEAERLEAELERLS